MCKYGPTESLVERWQGGNNGIGVDYHELFPRVPSQPSERDVHVNVNVSWHTSLVSSLALQPELPMHMFHDPIALCVPTLSSSFSFVVHLERYCRGTRLSGPISGYRGVYMAYYDPYSL